LSRNFAENVGLEFKTPEEYFLGESPREFVRPFAPESYIVSSDPISFTKSDVKEIVVFVGFPGSGKSTFFRKTLEPLGYERVNQDTLKSREKCIKYAAQYLSEGKSVAVDNTNADQEVRKIWISFATKHNVPVRCIHFTASKELAKHNAAVRSMSGHPEMNPEARENLPELAFNSFNSRYQEPKLEEGFSEIVAVDFRFLGSEEERAIWTKYWY
jgi:bifunctional polynucleotide phosphatase/kinase